MDTSEIGSGDLPEVIGVGRRGRAAVLPCSFLHAKSTELSAKLTEVSWCRARTWCELLRGRAWTACARWCRDRVEQTWCVVFVLVQVSRGSCNTSATWRAGSSNAMHARHMVDGVDRLGAWASLATVGAWWTLKLISFLRDEPSPTKWSCNTNITIRFLGSSLRRNFSRLIKSGSSRTMIVVQLHLMASEVFALSSRRLWSLTVMGPCVDHGSCDATCLFCELDLEVIHCDQCDILSREQ